MYYEYRELRKVHLAFLHPPEDFEQDAFKSDGFERAEQKRVTKIVSGKNNGRYFLLLGEKGVGKTGLILNAMNDVGHCGVVICEGHNNPEIFKLRLGRSLNFKYREDYIGALLGREAPERGSALLDVEKALNTMEKAAQLYYKQHGRSVVLVINNVQALAHDQSPILELLQQRAEGWAAQQIATVVFVSDEYIVYDLLRKEGNRMSVIKVEDLTDEEAFRFLKRKRVERKELDEELKQVQLRVGGRLRHLKMIADHRNIKHALEELEIEERAWVISHISPIPDFDSSQLESQRFSVAAWRLILALVRSENFTVSIQQAREVMSHSTWMYDLDAANIVTIDEHRNIRPDSVITARIMKEMCEDKELAKKLENVQNRLDAVDQENRTRELVWSVKNHRVFGRHRDDKWYSWFW